jgi:hypothetical protein
VCVCERDKNNSHEISFKPLLLFTRGSTRGRYWSEATANGDFVQVGSAKKLFVTSGELDSLREHAVYFLRTNPKGVNEKTVGKYL